jgi:hypothetical protein
VAASVAAPTAHAQETAGAFQLGLSTSFISYTSGTTDLELPGGDVSADVSGVNWGLTGENGVVLELGYGVTEIVILGGFVQLGGSSQTTQVDLPGEPEVDRTEFGLLIGPKIEAMFSQGSTVRPFIGAGVGFLLSSVDDEDTGNDTSLTGVQLLGRLGLRAFAAEGFSIDPAVVFGWATASGEVDTGPTNVDTSFSAFNVGLGLGFSGWIL